MEKEQIIKLAKKILADNINNNFRGDDAAIYKYYFNEYEVSFNLTIPVIEDDNHMEYDVTMFVDGREPIVIAKTLTIHVVAYKM